MDAEKSWSRAGCAHSDGLTLTAVSSQKPQFVYYAQGEVFVGEWSQLCTSGRTTLQLSGFCGHRSPGHT